jgi:hypothetical protein
VIDSRGNSNIWNKKIVLNKITIKYRTKMTPSITKLNKNRNTNKTNILGTKNAIVIFFRNCRMSFLQWGSVAGKVRASDRKKSDIFFNFNFPGPNSSQKINYLRWKWGNIFGQFNSRWKIELIKWFQHIKL